MNDGWHDESTENVRIRLDENAEMVATLEMRRVSAVEDGGYA